jgi:3(or 17)beta-hydroxysteroid dehydrogenase
MSAIGEATTMEQAKAGRLAGKIALITGAASGIGRATAALFHAEGAKVAATDRNEAGLATLGTAADLVMTQDITDEAGWRAVVDAVVAKFGRLDILVNSAGVAALGNIETATLADWRKVNAVNVEGTFLGCREAVRAMKETGGGSIVNLSSVAGIIGDASSTAYCASKGAVRLLTKSAALHCARAGYNIRLNSVHPSFAETPMVMDGIARAKDPDRIRAGLARASPMGRMGKAEEVALTILFLASDESSFTTGGEFMVDGGLTAQ